MGADLCVPEWNEPVLQKYEPLFERAVRKRDSLPHGSSDAITAQREVEKYFDLICSEGRFQDSYNAACVLATLGLSWWGDVAPLCDEDRKIKGENLKRFRDMVANATQYLPTKEELIERGGYVAEGEDSVEEWHKCFREKRERLLAFLDEAIRKNAAIHCSL